MNKSEMALRCLFGVMVFVLASCSQPLSSKTSSTSANSGAASGGANQPSSAPNPLANSFISYPDSYLSLKSGQTIAVNGVTLQITPGGDLQVVDSQGKVLWAAGSKGNCAVAASCTLNLQSDGNLVLSAAGTPFWSSGTYNAGAFMTLSSQSPYLSIRDGLFNMLWPQAGGPGPIAMGAAARTANQAAPVSQFLNSLAVNSHIDQNGFSAATILAMLNYLGVKTLRDGWNLSLQATYAELAAQGVQFDVLASDPFAATTLSNLEVLAALAPGALTAVEGPNEINNFTFVCNGVTSQTGWPNANGPLAQSFMTQLFKSIHGDGKLAGTLVYDLTWAGTTNADQYGLLDLQGQADLGNIHFYPAGQPSRALQAAAAGAYHQVLPSQMVMTETGYVTATNKAGTIATNSVSLAAQAVMDLNLYLASFQQGFQKTYIYELYDEFQGYGLFNSDFTPKPAATAIHNLTTILADPGSGPAVPGQLSYTLQGFPALGHSLLLQKSNGVYELIIWVESEVFQNGADVAVTPVAVTIQLPQAASAWSLYDPFVSSTAQLQVQNTDSITIDVGAEALVIEITP